MPQDGDILLEGDFESFSFDDVLDVVSISRQALEVRLNRDAASGRLLVKSGQVIEADDPPTFTGKGAFVGLYQEPGTDFVVSRTGEAKGKPIGSLAELIAVARELKDITSSSSHQSLLEGSFDSYSLVEVLTVLGVSRQHLVVTLFREAGPVVLSLKAGKLLSCRDLASREEGLEVFRSVRQDPGHLFIAQVSRGAWTKASLGNVFELLAEPVEEPEPERQDELLSGDFSDFSVSDVFSALSISRQVVELVFRRDGRPVGAVLLRTGRVLSAEIVDSEVRGLDAFVQLYRNPPEAFSAYRRVSQAVAGEPLGLVSEWMQLAEAPDEALDETPVVAAERERAILEGNVSEWPLTDVLQVMSITRQQMKLTVMQGSAVFGSLTMKSGMVLHVACGEATGAEALSALRAHTSGSFRVVEQRGVQAPAQPVGSLQALLSEPPAQPPKTEAKAPSAAPPVAAPKAPAKKASKRELVLEGTLKDFSFREVLEVAALSRQCMWVRTYAGEHEVGQVVIRSGRVLSARAGAQSDPVGALSSLMLDAGRTFTVHREPAPADASGALTLNDALSAVQEQRADQQPTAIMPSVTGPAEDPTVMVDSGDQVLQILHALEASLRDSEVEAKLEQAQARLAALEAQLQGASSSGSAGSGLGMRLVLGLLLVGQVVTLLLLIVVLVMA